MAFNQSFHSDDQLSGWAKYTMLKYCSLFANLFNWEICEGAPTKLLGKLPEYLKVKSYNVNVQKSDDIKTTAEVTFLIDNKEIKCSGLGNGPVNALDNAIRSNFKRVEKYYKYFSDLKLLDYKVRILNTGTGATTRVLIESTDKTGKSWFTIGVSQNIIEASFKALIDSLEYKLFKEKAPANINEK